MGSLMRRAGSISLGTAFLCLGLVTAIAAQQPAAKSPSVAMAVAAGEAACAQTWDGAPSSKVIRPRTRIGPECTWFLTSSNDRQEYAGHCFGRPSRGPPYTGASGCQSGPRRCRCAMIDAKPRGREAEAEARFSPGMAGTMALWHLGPGRKGLWRSDATSALPSPSKAT